MSVNIKAITTITILVLLLVIPPVIYSFITKGYNNFIKLEIIGEQDIEGNHHRIPDFSAEYIFEF